MVAHFHYVIVGGILFALFGAFYYWYPKVTGRMLSETLGRWLFWLFVIGFHLTFDPWDAWTLEWSTGSPPPEYNFAVIPTVRSRRPLWDLKHPDDPDWKYE